MRLNKNKATLELAQKELESARRDLSLSIQKGNEKIRVAVRKCLDKGTINNLTPAQGLT